MCCIMLLPLYIYTCNSRTAARATTAREKTTQNRRINCWLFNSFSNNLNSIWLKLPFWCALLSFIIIVTVPLSVIIICLCAKLAGSYLLSIQFVLSKAWIAFHVNFFSFDFFIMLLFTYPFGKLSVENLPIITECNTVRSIFAFCLRFCSKVGFLFLQLWIVNLERSQRQIYIYICVCSVHS